MDQRAVYQLISALTKNEDLRQDLWVAYLSKDIPSTFTNKLKQLSQQQELNKHCSDNISKILELNIPEEALNELSDLQRSILLMVVLGYSLEQISEYNGVKQVTINREMVSLSKHPVWVTYGIKKESEL